MARSAIRRSLTDPPPPPRTPPRSPKPPLSGGGGGFARLLRRITAWLFALGLLAGIALGVAVVVAAQSLPTYQDLKSRAQGQMIVVRARDGSELVSLGPSYGKWLSIAEIPPVMQNAMISVEDRRFYDHYGVDPIGVLRSLFVRVESGKWRQGGSTITQQLARNVFLNNNRTFARKANEAVLAIELETRFTKQQILELYQVLRPCRHRSEPA